MKCYPAYKDSGIEWIGKVPESWTNKRLKYLARLINEKGLAEGENLPINLENIESWTGRLTTCEAGEKESSDDEMKQFKAGDVLFNKLRPYLAKVYRARANGVCGGELLVLRSQPENMRAGFLFYRLVSKDFIGVVDGATYGTKMPRASWEFIGNLRIPYPSIQEQEAISSYLVDKTEQIETLITKKERMIELLREERAAVINQAVTKGLDSSVEIKDSGIEWLGKVPKSWKIKRLKYVGKVIIGLTYAPEETSTTGTLVLRSSNIQDGKIVFDDTVYVNKQIPDKLLVKNGDILVCSRNGSRSLIGKCARINDGHKGHAFGAFMTIFRGPSNRFVYYVFNSTIFAFHIGSFLTATINQLTTENLNGIIIALPSEKEQLAIAEFLDVKTAQIDAQIDRAKKSVQLLKEHRTALISEAVTGKIDVRSNGELKHGG